MKKTTAPPASAFGALLLAAMLPLGAQTPAPTQVPVAPPPAAPPAAQQDGKPVPQRAMIVKYSLLVPADKTYERVRPGERNPYGKSEDNSLPAFKGTNEENLIRDQLVKLRASGASLDKNDTHVMLGDMILRPGQLVPKVLPHQTLALRVARIKQDSIELQWVEKKYSNLPPRILTIPMDLRPVVHYKLQGQPVISTLPEGTNKGIKMGEQTLSDLMADASTGTEMNSVPRSQLGAAWQGDGQPSTAVVQPAVIASGAPQPALPAKLAAENMPPLARVNLETVSRFVPKRPLEDGTIPGNIPAPATPSNPVPVPPSMPVPTAVATVPSYTAPGSPPAGSDNNKQVLFTPAAAQNVPDLRAPPMQGGPQKVGGGEAR